MTRVLQLGHGGFIIPQRVVAIAGAKSAPIIRLLKATDPSRIIDLTYGYPRRSVVIMDNGYVVLSSRTQKDIARAIGLDEEKPHEKSSAAE